MQPFNPNFLTQQETSYFNRAIGHAYKAQQARAQFFGGTRRANRETAEENGDINTVGILLHKRGVDVSFQDILAHVHARAAALSNGNRSYTYNGYAYSAYPLQYYTGGRYNYFDASDAFLMGAFGELAISAIERAYMDNQYYALQNSGYFDTFYDGGFDSSVEFYSNPVAGDTFYDNSGAYVGGAETFVDQNGAAYVDNGTYGGGTYVDSGTSTGVVEGAGTGGDWGGGGAVADQPAQTSDWDNTGGGYQQADPAPDQSGGGNDWGGSTTQADPEPSSGGSDWGGGGGNDGGGGGGGSDWGDSGGSSGGGGDSGGSDF